MARACFILLLLLTVIAPGNSLAADKTKEPVEMHWSFNGIWGSFDKQSIQRGYQVYKEICASCHSLKRIAYRNLADLAFAEEEIKAIAAGNSVKDGPNEDGEMFERHGRPSDKFVSPFANDKAARAANNGALPPDLSLIVKAREGGADYIYSILTGYDIVPTDVKMAEGMNYNLYFPGRQIAMANPLSDGAVTYIDGTEASVQQMAHDVVSFLQWAAEPEMEKRKRMGIKVMLFLLIFTGLFIAAKRRVWSRLDEEDKQQ